MDMRLASASEISSSASDSVSFFLVPMIRLRKETPFLLGEKRKPDLVSQGQYDRSSEVPDSAHMYVFFSGEKSMCGERHHKHQRNFRLTTYFFSLGSFKFDASPRAALWSDKLYSELPASASYDARPNNFRGMDFCVLVRLMMCYNRVLESSRDSLQRSICAKRQG